MKIAFTICATLVILIVSCKKSNDHINTPPVVTDTTKPPVVNVDTSTLLKSMREYSYNGTIIVDSELTQWIYDDQRRIIQNTYAFGSSNDTTRYIYLNDRYIATFDGYTKGSLRAISNTVYYLGLKDRVDSILSSTTGYGIETGSNNSSATYIYYNQENQDTLEMYFSGIQTGSYPEDSIKYFYTGMNLDSAIVWTPYPDSGMQKNMVDYFSNGDLSSQPYYENNVLGGVTNFTYTNIPTGGLYIAYVTDVAYLSFFRTTHLKSESTTNYVTVIGTQIYSYTYELDAANRVKTMISSTNGVVDQRYEVTYY
jgi:hypothetical protein